MNGQAVIFDAAFKLQQTDAQSLELWFNTGWSKKMRQYFWKGLLPLGLCFSLTFGGMLPVALAQNVPGRIEIVVVDGEGATIAIRQRAAKDPALRIEDDDHQPVANAAVVFTLPLSGASGEFADGSKSLTVLTDRSGIATARGLRANAVPGKLQIYVTASFRGLRASGLINLAVEAPPGVRAPAPDVRTAKSSGKWKWIVLGIVVAGGAGAGAYYYYSNHNSNSSAISVSAGSVVFGSPR